MVFNEKQSFQICDVLVYFNYAQSLLSKKLVRDSTRNMQKQLKSKKGHSSSAFGFFPTQCNRILVPRVFSAFNLPL